MAPRFRHRQTWQLFDMEADPYEKENSYPATAQLDILTHLSDSLAQVNTEFFIWPETAIAEQTDENRIRGSRYFYQVQQFLNKYKNGNVMLGAVIISKSGK